MIKSTFIEDIFLEFSMYVDQGVVSLQQQDWSAVNSFANVIANGRQLTQNQANFLLKILEKYKLVVIKFGMDYSEEIKNPKWKQPFRVLDLSKKVYVEKDSNGELFICARFPFSLKDEFSKEIVPKISDAFATSNWDPEDKCRKLKFYDYNLVAIYEFAMKHGFEIDDTFMIALADVEEIWQEHENVIPYSTNHFGVTVDLVNAPHEVNEWFFAHREDSIGADMLLAKSMGYPLKHDRSNTMAARIASSNSNKFWLKSNEQFIELYREVGGPVAVILDKGSSSTDWVKEFFVDTMGAGLDKNDLRVCFRLNKEEDKTGFNQWVKDHELGGPVEGGKIFIFQQKPPKWLFSQDVPVKIILTNSLYPLPSNISQTWMNNHTCVCFIGEVKAANNKKDNNIVEL